MIRVATTSDSRPRGVGRGREEIADEDGREGEAAITELLEAVVADDDDGREGESEAAITELEAMVADDDERGERGVATTELERIADDDDDGIIADDDDDGIIADDDDDGIIADDDDDDGIIADDDDEGIIADDDDDGIIADDDDEGIIADDDDDEGRIKSDVELEKEVAEDKREVDGELKKVCVVESGGGDSDERKNEATDELVSDTVLMSDVAAVLVEIDVSSLENIAG